MPQKTLIFGLRSIRGTLDDVFYIQEKVSRSIVDELKLKLNPEENKKIAERPIDNIHAYECYLKAKQEIWRFTEEALDRALKLIQNGLEIVGENELLYFCKGYVYFQLVNFGIKADELYLQKAKECINKVFDLNPYSSYGHFLGGLIHYKLGEIQEAVRALKKALEIDPHNPEILLWLSFFYCMVGKGITAKPLVKKVLEMDPLTLINYLPPGFIDLSEGRFEAALEHYHKMYQMETESPISRFWYSLMLAFNHRFEEAYSIIDLIIKDTPQTIFAWIGLFLKYALQGEKRKALKSVIQELIAAARWDEMYSLWLADCYALIAKKEEALDWLENAVNRGFINYPYLSEYDPFLENIRGEERFKKLMKKVKYEWEHFDV